MTAARVSVVMSAWNAERFVEEAVRSAIGQTRPPGEIIVVDDGSTDGTAAAAENLNDSVRVLRVDHGGIGRARNTGVACASGDLIAFLDADDVWLPHKLERQLARLDADPSVEAVFCKVDEFYDWDVGSQVHVRPLRTNTDGCLASAALLRRELVEQLGPFSSVPFDEWVRWWARARAMGVREHVVPEVLFRRRIHGGNNALRHRDQARALLAIVRDQRRARTSDT